MRPILLLAYIVKDLFSWGKNLINEKLQECWTDIDEPLPMRWDEDFVGTHTNLEFCDELECEPNVFIPKKIDGFKKVFLAKDWQVGEWKLLKFNYDNDYSNALFFSMDGSFVMEFRLVIASSTARNQTLQIQDASKMDKSVEEKDFQATDFLENSDISLGKVLLPLNFAENESAVLLVKGGKHSLFLQFFRDDPEDDSSLISDFATIEVRILSRS